MTDPHFAADDAPYRRFLLDATPRLLGQLDREPLSPTWGSFDRDHWAWKFRDFPINMLQTGLLPLAWLHSTPFPENRYAGNRQLQRWLIGGLERLLSRQHANGAFDTVAPNSQDHGVTLAMAYTTASLLHLLPGAIPEQLHARARDSVRRACTFADKSEEDYAFISNHQALFALAWLRAGLLLDDDALVARGDATIAEIVRQQSADGWYREYGGPDPGYESLGILYLAMYRELRASRELDRSLERSLEFYSHCIHPDGSVGGGYGSRHTSLWYPGGFELLANDFPLARAVARFLRARLDSANVVTPATVDSHNLPSLLYGYCTAARSADLPAKAAPGAAPPLLPCEMRETWRHFNESGIVVAGKPHYFAIANLQKGGSLVVFDRERIEVAYEDAGYVVHAQGRDWSSGLLDATGPASVSGNSAQVSTAFGLAQREVLTPLKFLILRILNLTVFRSVALGALVRRMIIARLVTNRSNGPFHLNRRIDFAPDSVGIHDELTADEPQSVTGVWRPRSYTAVHMGSARYFSIRDLDDAGQDGSGEFPSEKRLSRLRETGRLTLELLVSFTHGTAARIAQHDHSVSRQ